MSDDGRTDEAIQNGKRRMDRLEDARVEDAKDARQLALDQSSTVGRIERLEGGIIALRWVVGVSITAAGIYLAWKR